MTNGRAAWLLALGMVAAADAAELPPSGGYAVTSELEIPHIGGPAWRGTRFVCLGAGGDTDLPVPVLALNNPFVGCVARDVERTATELRYRIVCAGRDAARAQASYRLGPDGFTGEIAMVLGAKNMTLTERQTGRREGDCLAAATAGR